MSPQPSLQERFAAARSDPDLAVLEGFHVVKHALRFGAVPIDAVSPDPERLAELTADLAPDLASRLAELVRPVPTELFRRLAPRPPATGVLALAPRPPRQDVLAAPGPGPVVLLERPARLGNLGAAVRVAAAAGAAGLLAVGPHDPWHPEALRGGAGLQYALPVERADTLAASGRPLVAVHPSGRAGGARPLPPRALLAFGGERHGLSDELLGRAERVVSIPMREGVSSLNLAVAVGVALYTLLPRGG